MPEFKLEIIQSGPKRKTKKPPLLFIHGMFHGAWCWKEHFMPYFSKQGYTCYAVSLRGHGKSEGKETVWRATVNDYLKDIHRAAEQILRETGKHPVLIGHSMGGILSQLYIEKYPAAGCVLLASVPPWGLMPVTLRVIKKTPLLFLKINLKLNMFEFVKTPALFKKAFFYAISNRKIIKYHKLISNDSYLAFMQLIFYKFSSPSKISIPVAVFGGEKDSLLPTPGINGTAKAYKSEAEIFQNMGHELMLEDGHENVATSIYNWLKKL
ncbi:MAG: lysophospholipase [Spirochaetia bacterium]|nr:lysophospholipase [Spirochaetia bacterium]